MAYNALTNLMGGAAFRTRINTMMEELYGLVDDKADIGHTHDTVYYTQTVLDGFLAGKVNVESGMGLSENDYSDAEKAKCQAGYDYSVISHLPLSDVVNDLTTGGTSKALSAAQGVALKTLVDGKAGMVDDATGVLAAASTYEGMLRYSEHDDATFLDICMKTGTDTYTWVTIATESLTD